jgi:hypothetical protein
MDDVPSGLPLESAGVRIIVPALAPERSVDVANVTVITPLPSVVIVLTYFVALPTVFSQPHPLTHIDAAFVELPL